MRILMLTPSLPDRLSRVRAHNLLSCLSRRHEVVLLSLVASRERRRKMEGIAGYCRCAETVVLPRWKSLGNCVTGLAGNLPLRVLWCESRQFRERLREMIANESFDLVYVKRGRMAPYLTETTGLPSIMDLTDSMAMFYERVQGHGSVLDRLIGRMEYRRQRRYEAEVWQKADACLVCSHVDARYLERISAHPWPNLHVVPNVVDTSFFTPSIPALSEPGRILISGDMRALVNQDAVHFFCRKVWPMVRRRCPSARLAIVGAQPPYAITRYADLPGVEVPGFVPDLRTEIVRAQVVVCPIRLGAGTRNKILQALATKRPVVSTTGGVEGLELEHGKHLLVADAPAMMAETVAWTLSDPEGAHEIAQRGNVQVQMRYSLDALADSLEPILDSVRGVRERKVPS